MTESQIVTNDRSEHFRARDDLDRRSKVGGQWFEDVPDLADVDDLS